MGQKGVVESSYRKKERVKGEMKRGSGRQLKAMLRKNWLLKRRHPFVTLMEILLPTFVMLMLIGVRSKTDLQVHPAQEKVALLNGITMASGAGVSIPGTFRVATDKTVFAMPESRIGFHPDAGASFHLSRLAGYLGKYLGLTGDRLNGVEMLSCGLATHYSLASKFPLIKEHLATLLTDDPSVIDESLQEFRDMAHPDHTSVIHWTKTLDKCFCYETVEDIVDALETEAGKTQDPWCVSTLKKLKEASPLSLKVALRSVHISVTVYKLKSLRN